MPDGATIERCAVEPTAGAIPVASAAAQVRGLTATGSAAWERYIAEHPEGTLFHTLAWRDAVAEAFGHEAVYLTADRNDRMVGVLPLFYVPSRIGGRMLVSVPYGVGGGILANDDAASHALFAAARQIALDRRCVCLEFRSARAVVPGLAVEPGYAGFERAMPTESAAVLAWLPRKARAAARGGREKHALTTEWGDEHLRVVWQLYSLNMRRLGSIAYPFLFFDRLAAATPGRHWVSVVRQGRQIVAGLVTFLYRDRVMPYFFGATAAARRCCAANSAYLAAMEQGVEEGYRVFDFGRSRRDNTGSYDFKRFHGFEPRPLGYQRWTPAGTRIRGLLPTDPKFRAARRLWKYLPLRVTQTLGARLARHIPG